MRPLLLPLRLLALLIATPALGQPALPLPLLYTVTGVAANDTLNVRAAPNAGAADMGDLAPGQTVEILSLSADGRWGEVSAGENIGWVSMRYMALTPGTTGKGEALPYGVPLHLSCGGTEPFWSAEISSGSDIALTNYATDPPRAERFPMQGMAKPPNIGPYIYGFSAAPLSGVIRREGCSDGMSDSRYGWSIEILRNASDGVFMLSGCCRAVLN